jgi:hypothetical protein
LIDRHDSARPATAHLPVPRPWVTTVVLCLSAVTLLIPALAAILTGEPAAAKTVPIGPYWTIMPSANTSAAETNTLASVDCTSATACVAVGTYQGGSAVQTLTESFSDGRWNTTPSADIGTNVDNSLLDVTCLSGSDCVAVGDTEQSTDRTLIEAFNGVDWSTVPSPNTEDGQSNDLDGVSCQSATSCVAVGYFFDGSNFQTLIETYDGINWSITPSPDVAGTNDFLAGVSCSSTSCTAVGTSSGNGQPTQTLIETLTGSVWSVVPSPDSDPTQTDSLASVSCTSASSCVAVGYHEVAIQNQTLVETFNGSSWSIAPSPNTGDGTGSALDGVSCLSATACTAVGTSLSGANIQQTLIESLNGTTWSITASADTGASQDNVLSGVSCTSSVSCSAVGSYGNGVLPDQTLVESIAIGPPAPTVTDIAPATGPLYGGSPVTISGANFTGAREVRFGSVPARSFTIHDDNTIVALAPSGIAGTNNVTVTTAQGTSPVVSTARYTATGYWEVAADGGVFPFGANFFGSTGRVHLAEPIVAVARTSSGNGYWFTARDGGIFSFGNAGFYGSLPQVGVSVDNIVGMAADPRTGGYWLVASDGGMFAFNAPYFGSVPGLSLHVDNIVGMAATPDGGGYFAVGSDGGVFAFGDARFQGSMGGQSLNRPIVGIATDPATGGYWEVASDGGIFSFGAPFEGSTGAISLNEPIVGMASNAEGSGYWLVASDGGVFAFGAAPFDGSMGGQPLNKPMVGLAGA